MKNLPLWPFLAFRTIVESIRTAESMGGWGTNPTRRNHERHCRKCIGIAFAEFVGSLEAILKNFPLAQFPVLTGEANFERLEQCLPGRRGAFSPVSVVE
jgi:hypothetical protein